MTTNGRSETEGTGQFLGWMARRNLQVVALDGRREWYRYHHLLGELLQTELVLPLLSVYRLSFREIGDRLCVSFHTVKSQAYSVYQKLGVSPHSQAVARSHELGLDNQQPNRQVR
jgi:ATP/maltotriose-dependent transcriptional regulator MalT